MRHAAGCLGRRPARCRELGPALGAADGLLSTSCKARTASSRGHRAHQPAVWVRSCWRGGSTGRLALPRSQASLVIGPRQLVADSIPPLFREAQSRVPPVLRPAAARTRTAKRARACPRLTAQRFKCGAPCRSCQIDAVAAGLRSKSWTRAAPAAGFSSAWALLGCRYRAHLQHAHALTVRSGHACRAVRRERPRAAADRSASVLMSSISALRATCPGLTCAAPRPSRADTAPAPAQAAMARSSRTLCSAPARASSCSRATAPRATARRSTSRAQTPTIWCAALRGLQGRRKATQRRRWRVALTPARAGRGVRV